MSDPLSIAAGVVGLLQVSFSVAAELKKFHDGVKVVYATISSLQHEVDTLNRVLTSARTTFEAITADRGSAMVASHWQNITDLIETTKAILSQFLDEIVVINKPHDILDHTRKQLRVRFAESKVDNFRVLVQSFHSSLSVSMQCIIMWDQVSLRRTIETAIPNLFELQKDVRRIALKLNDRQDRCAKEPSQMRAFDQMRKCVKTAASVLSSASSVAEAAEKGNLARSDCGTIAGSDFNDCFPAEMNLPLHRYMISRSSYEDRVADFAMPAYFAKHHAHDLVEGHSDSEADEDSEVALSLMKSGKSLLDFGDGKAAEKKFRSCLQRLSGSNWQTRGSESLLAAKIDAMDGLLAIYTRQQRWSDAKEMLLAKLGLGDEFGYQDKARRAEDLLHLAQVLKADKCFHEARSYARKAVKIFKGLNERTHAATCIELLADIAHEEDEADWPSTPPSQLSKMEITEVSVEEGPYETSVKRFSRVSLLPLSPPETPGEQGRGTSPSRPTLARQPSYRMMERSSPPSSPSALTDPTPELIITPAEEDGDPLLTLDTNTSTATSLTLSSSLDRGRRLSAEHAKDGDEDLSSRSGDETDKSSRTSRRRSLTSSLRTRSPKVKTATRVKLVAVGDSASDIPGLFSRFFQTVNKDSAASMQATKDSLVLDFEVDSKSLEIELVAVNKQDASDVALSSLCSDVSAILACFSIGVPDSLELIQNKWIPLIRKISRNAPVTLVGTQQDLRADLGIVQMLASKLQHPVTRLEGQDMVLKVGAHSYMECSARTGDGVRSVFEQASRLGALHMKRTKSRWKLWS